MIYLLVILIVVVGIIVFKFVYTYYKGKAFETWYKIAVTCSYKKLLNDLKDEKLGKAVFDQLFLFDEKDQTIKEFAEKNRKLIEDKASDVISQDADFREVIIQTLFVKLAVSRGYDNRADFDAILNNKIFKSHFLQQHTKPYGLHEYTALVEKFCKKHGLINPK